MKLRADRKELEEYQIPEKEQEKYENSILACYFLGTTYWDQIGNSPYSEIHKKVDRQWKKSGCYFNSWEAISEELLLEYFGESVSEVRQR